MSGRQSNNGGRGGRGGGRTGRGGHGFGRTTNRSTTNNNRNFSYTRGAGACEELKEHVYTVGNANSADKYVKTTERIVNYIQTNYEEGQDVKDALVTLEPLDFEDARPGGVNEEDLDFIDRMILQQEVKDYVTRIRKYNDNMNKAYGLILGQCTQGVKNKLEARRDWQTLEEEHSPIDLLKAIKEITQDYQDSRYPIASIYKSLSTLFNIKQDEKESLSAYIKRFKNAQDIMETQHGKLELLSYITKLDEYNENRHDELADTAYNKLMAYIFIAGTDPKKSGNLLKELSNDFALGSDKYPKTVATAASAVANYRPEKNNNMNTRNRNPRNNNNNNNTNNTDAENQMGFAQKHAEWLKNVTCYVCKEKGHIAKNCPNQQGASNAQTCQPCNNSENNENNGDSNNTNNTNDANGANRAQVNFLNHGISMYENNNKQHEL